MTALLRSSDVDRDRALLTRDAASCVTGQPQAPDNTLVIRDAALLQAWRQQLRTIRRARNLPAPLFQLPGLSHEQNQSISALANSYQKACGCASGGFFMSATVVATVASFFVSGRHLTNITLTHVVVLVGITALAALSGKLVGLLWARWRLLRLAASIHDTVVGAARQETR